MGHMEDGGNKISCRLDLSTFITYKPHHESTDEPH
jgi:hypothetical protein